MSLFLRFEVIGHSMEPAIKNGQEIIVSKIPFWLIPPRKGDIVAFDDNGMMIVKRITEAKKSKFKVKGDNKKDSKDYGWIERKNIIGKVVYKFSR